VTADREHITPVHYRAADGYPLDLEVLTALELRRRVLAVPHRGVESVDLLCLLYVSRGRYAHMVDFETYRCSTGSVLTVQPGQVHRFGSMGGWDGWFVVARSEHTGARYPSSGPIGDPSELPVHVQVDATARSAIDGTLAQMENDAHLDSPVALRNALLFHQFRGLVARLQLGTANSETSPGIEPVVLQRFRDFRAEVEREHARWHAVAPYARRIGCSERSLTRTTEAVAGLTAKSFITRRIVLEAKRLLVHTSAPVATIAETLGFDEPTNFVKYFRRETGTTPGAFRTASHDAGARPPRDPPGQPVD